MPIRPKTRRRLLLLVLIGVVLIGAGTGVFLYRKHQIRQDMLAKRAEGMAAFEQGDYSTAMHSVGSYLNRYPEDVEALYAYAVSRREVTEPDGEHLRQAIGMFRRVMELEPKHQDARTALLELYPRVGFNTEALQLADEQLRHDPDDATALWAKARALAAVRRFVDAVPVAENYTRQKPEDLSGHLLLFSLYDALNEPDEPYIEHAERMADRLADHPVMPLLRATVFLLTDDREQAEAWAAVAAEREPPDADYALQVANTLERLDRFQAAGEYLQDVTDPHAAPQLQRALAHHLWQSGRVEALIKRLDHLDAADEQTPADLLGIKAMALLSAGQNDQASPIIDALGQREEDQVAAAWHRVLDTSQQQPQVSPQQIIAACDEALRTLKNHPYFLTIKAEALASVGEHDLAIAAWSQAAQRAPAWPAPVLAMGRALLETGRPEQAQQAARLAMQRRPDSLSAVVLVAESTHRLVEQPSGERADRLMALVEQVQQIAPGEPRTAAIRVDLLARRGQNEPARQQIQTLLDGDRPLATEALLRLAEISRRHDLGLAEACLAESQRLHGPTAAVDYTRAIGLARKDKPERGRQLLQNAIDARSADAALPWRLALVRYLSAIGSPQATAAWKQLANQHPDNRRIQRLALDADPVWRDLDFVAELLERLKTDNQQQTVTWRVARCRHLLQSDGGERNARRAADTLTQVIAAAPTALEPRLLAVTAYQRLGNRSAALEQLGAVIELRPRDRSLQLELAGLLLSQGQAQRAQAVLERVAADDLNADQQRRAASLFRRMGRVDRAIELVVAIHGGDEHAPDLLLASLYRQADQLDAAEAVYRRLLDESPSAPAVEFTANLLASRDRVAEAEAVLGRLDELDLEPGVAASIRANFAARYQGVDAALAAYRKAAQSNPRLPRMWRMMLNYLFSIGRSAEAMQAVQQAHQALPDDQTFALLHRHRDLLTFALPRAGLRPVATALIQQPQYQDACIEALSLVKADAHAGTATVERIARMRQLADRHTSCLPLQSLMVQMYMGVDQPEDAADVATRAMQAFPNAAEPAWFAAEALAAAGRWAEALGVARQWRQRSADEPIAADLFIAEVHRNRGESDLALAQTDRYLEQARQDPQAYRPVLISRARALISAGRAEQAHDMITPLLDKGPGWRAEWLKLAVLVVQDDRTSARWLDILDQHIPDDATAERVSLAQGWYTLGQRAGNAAHLETARRILDSIVADQGDDPQALLTLALILDTTHQDEQAAACYRRALEADPMLAQAHNNLAMILVDTGGDPDQAIKHAHAACRTQPRDASYLDTLALAHLAANQPDPAVTAMQKAVRIAPARTSLRINLAWALHQAGRHADALRQLDQALGADPDLDQLTDPQRQRVNAIREAARQAANTAPAPAG